MSTHRDKQEIEQLAQTWQPPLGLLGWLMTVNQTSIGKRYLLTSLIFFLAAGVLGLLIRTQLALPENEILGPELYNQLFTMHGTAMMFLFAIPMVEGFGVYLAPLMIGTRDLSFPRLSAFSYFVFVVGGVVLWLSLFFGAAPDTGWFSYVPLALKQYSSDHRVDVYATVITFIEIAALAAAVELIVTILKQRAPGMTLRRMPPFVWSILVMAFMIVFAMPGVIVGSLMLALDRLLGTAFYDVARGGDPLLWQHQFWWFGHPEVYILFIPAAGIVSTILPVFCARKLFGYTAVISSFVAIGFVSFALWVHHMFTTGIPEFVNSFFSAASGLIALPSGLLVFCWLATVIGGRPTFKSPLLYSLGSIVLFILGGFTGVMVAVVPFDKQVHDTYFVVAHFHYVLVGGVLFPLLAGFQFWWPKITGRMLPERGSQVVFWTIFIGFNITFFPMHLLGFAGMPRRVYTYLEHTGWGTLNLICTIGAFILALGILLFLVNIVRSLRSGAPAGNNPWGADTLEWGAASPPESYNLAFIPTVSSASPLWDGELTPAISGMDPTQREVLVTTAFEARPQAVVILPGPSIMPLILALAVGIGFIGVIFSPWWFVVGFTLAFFAASAWLWPNNSKRRRSV